MTEQEFDSRVRQMEGKMYRMARSMLRSDSDCGDALLGAVRERGIRVSLGYGLTETSSGVALSTGDDFHAMTVCPEDEVTIADDGIPYNPLEKPDAVTPDDVMDVPIGGLGILMAKRSVNEMAYERNDGSNVVSIVKKW